MINVLAVTSWGGACGIANYADLLIEAVRQADPSIMFQPRADYLDPTIVSKWSLGPEILWLNYHRGLHSRWTPEEVQRMKQGSRKVVITFHDTYGEREPDGLTVALHDLADAFIVHEPCVGLLKQILIRQGVPGWQLPLQDDQLPLAWCGPRPILGTCGFNFPWKNFSRLAEVTAACGWAYLVLSNNATDADELHWQALNQHTLVVRGFLPTEEMVRYLAGCDATCFAYECANSGTSGAIRLGLAARKPVFAPMGCRQFRDLLLTDTGYWTLGDYRAVQWYTDWEDLAARLQRVPIQRVAPGVVYLAERDSWATQGRKYAEVFKSVLQ